MARVLTEHCRGIEKPLEGLWCAWENMFFLFVFFYRVTQTKIYSLTTTKYNNSLKKYIKQHGSFGIWSIWRYSFLTEIQYFVNESPSFVSPGICKFPYPYVSYRIIQSGHSVLYSSKCCHCMLDDQIVSEYIKLAVISYLKMSNICLTLFCFQYNIYHSSSFITGLYIYLSSCISSWLTKNNH